FTRLRYRLDSTVGPITGFAVTAATTVSATYVTQYQVSFDQSGIGGDTGANTVVTVGGVPFAAGALADTRFWDNGTTWSFSSPVASSSTSKQYRLTSGPAIASGTIGSGQAGTTITGAYNTQFLVTFSQSGIGGDTTATVVTVGGVPSAAGALADTRFWDNGTTWSFSSPVASSSTSKQ